MYFLVRILNFPTRGSNFKKQGRNFEKKEEEREEQRPPDIFIHINYTGVMQYKKKTQQYATAPLRCPVVDEF